MKICGLKCKKVSEFGVKIPYLYNWKKGFSVKFPKEKKLARWGQNYIISTRTPLLFKFSKIKRPPKQEKYSKQRQVQVL